LKEKYDSREWQKDTKAKNEAKIMQELMNGPKRFTDLQKNTELSATGLTKILRRMRDETKTIQQIQQKNRLVYTITKSGKRAYHESLEFGMWLNSIQDRGGHYIQDYSGMRGEMYASELKWGPEDDLIIDKKLDGKANPISRELALDLQKFIFKKLYDDTQKRKIVFDESLDGMIALCFYFDYKGLRESIKNNSLKLQNSITKEEFEIRYKQEDETSTREETQLLNDLKIGKITRKEFLKQVRKLK